MVRKDLEDQLKQFEKLNVEGKYQEAIHQFLMREADPTIDENDPLILKLKLHYAMALQHAGLFLNASEYFQLIMDESSFRMKSTCDEYDCIRQTAMLHLAILLERLKLPERAIKVLDDLGEINTAAVKLAWASPASFLDITYMKSYLQLGKLQPIKEIIRRVLTGDENQQLWGRLFEGIVLIKEGTSQEKKEARVKIQSVLNAIEVKDPHGAPWFSLTAGQYLIAEDRLFAKKLLIRSNHRATMERKLFIVAEASHYLSRILYAQNKKADAEKHIRRAVGGYQRCGVLLRPPLQEEVYREVIDIMGQSRGRRIFTLTAGIIDPHSLHFGRMCVAHAEEQTNKAKKLNHHADKIDPWEIFEEYVRDWAEIKFDGEVKECNRNQATVDIVCKTKKGCIYIQAKLVKNPKSARPSNDPPIKRIRTQYGKLSKYVFVVANSGSTGWKKNDWDASCDEKVWEKMPEYLNRRVFDQAVTEPALQIDTVLEPALFDKYFRYHLE